MGLGGLGFEGLDVLGGYTWTRRYLHSSGSLLRCACIPLYLYIHTERVGSLIRQVRLGGGGFKMRFEGVGGWGN